MLLRIIDRTETEQRENCVELILTTDDKTVISYQVDDFPCLISQNFQHSLHWYFSHYPQSNAEPLDTGDCTDKGVAEKIITLGQELGDALLGEDHELVKLKETIEDDGYENLQVQIESGRLAFNRECWEALILPESKYVLAGVAQAFVRQFIPDGSATTQDQPDRHYELSNDSPLNILHLISRPKNAGLDNVSNQGFDRSVNTLCFNRAFGYEIACDQGLSALKKRLTDTENPLHILHFDGPIEIRQAVPYLLLHGLNDTVEAVSVADIASLLVECKVALLCIEAQAYYGDNDSVNASTGLAYIAQAAMTEGLGNIVGLSNPTNPWTASQCFEALYTGMAAGFSLAQAVVEARKNLQRYTETALFSSNAKPFQFWSLLTHYGNQTVYFFADAIVSADLHTTEYYQQLRTNLYGFDNGLLPPEVLNCIGGNFLPLLESCRPGSLSYLSGISGSGKTHLCHQLAFYLLRNADVAFAFYFNYARDFYSRTDIIDMIAPVSGLSVDRSETIEAIVNQRCCFVFDNIDKLRSDDNDTANDNGTSELFNWIRSLSQQQHIVLLTGACSHPDIDDVSVIPVRPILEDEQRVLYAQTLRLANLAGTDEDKQFYQLLDALRGSPFLIRKVLPCLAMQNIEDLCRQVDQRLMVDENIAENYYHWQFTSLALYWQRLLLVLLASPGLLMEMIGVAYNRNKDFQPGRDFLTLLGCADADFSEGVEILDRAGFLKHSTQGKVLNPHSYRFLKAKLSQDNFISANEDKLNLLFSQLVCEGLAVTASYLQKQPNIVLQNNILLSRKDFAKHLERLWFAEDYQGFMQARHQLANLMRQQKLEGEMAAWSINLLDRSDMDLLWPEDTAQQNHKTPILCCLSLAQQALNHQTAEQQSTLVGIAKKAQRYIDNMAPDEYWDTPELFNNSHYFLQDFYRKRADWQMLQQISELATEEYQRRQMWALLIRSLSLWAQSCFQLGNAEQGLELERRILEDLPYDKLPASMKAQLMREIILARDIRGESTINQPLLDTYKRLPEAEGDQLFIDNIQAEIYLRQKHYEKAAGLYLQLFDKASKGEQPRSVLEHLEQKLDLIKEKIGAETYSKICKNADTASLK